MTFVAQKPFILFFFPDYTTISSSTCTSISVSSFHIPIVHFGEIYLPNPAESSEKKEQMGQRIPSLFVKPTGVRNIVFSLIFLLGSNASAYLVIVIVIIHGQIHLSNDSRC